MAKKQDMVATGVWSGTADAIIGVSATTNITATAGGGQANAALLPSVVNIITTCATAGDSVKLPASPAVGDEIYVLNKGAASVNIFPQTGGVINALAANAAIAVGAGKSALCKALNSTDWLVVVSA